jgi:muramidase (phage lysozyme)
MCPADHEREIVARAVSGNLGAFLDMLAVSEIGRVLLSETDDGYDVLVGATPSDPTTFPSYADHPRQLIHIGAHLESTASGRYQILERNYDFYKAKLGLTDFSPGSQDRIAAQMISERSGAMEAITEGRFADAVAAVRNLWASLPGAGYLQHENQLADLETAYTAAGGTLA